ncbi:MAG TPA: flippase [Thermoleophilaceae bacterium]|nr:flippase [Thermoleophilaceae bacterium]
MPRFEQSRAAWRGLLLSSGTLLSGQLVARLIGFATVFVLARAIEPSGFGLVTLGATLVIFFGILVDAGTEVLNVRDVAREPRSLRAIVEPILGLRLALSFPAAALFGVAVFAAADSSADRVALGLFALVLPMVALNPRWIVVAVGGSKAIVAGSVIKELVLFAGVILLVRELHDTMLVALLVAVGELASALVVLRWTRRRFGVLRPRIDLPAWRQALRSGWPMLVNNLARTGVISLDVVLIALLLDRESVGLYSAAYKPVLFLISAMALYFVSFLAHYSAAGGEDAKQLFRRTVTLAVMVTVPAALLVATESSFFVRFAYGDAFAGAAAALAVLAWSVPIAAISEPYRQTLIAGGRERLLMRNNVVGALVNLAANLAVIPLFGIVGAAVVTLVSEALIAALNARAVVTQRLERSPVSVLADYMRWHRPRLPRRAD